MTLPSDDRWCCAVRSVDAAVAEAVVEAAAAVGRGGEAVVKGGRKKKKEWSILVLQQSGRESED